MKCEESSEGGDVYWDPEVWENPERLQVAVQAAARPSTGRGRAGARRPATEARTRGDVRVLPRRLPLVSRRPRSRSRAGSQRRGPGEAPEGCGHFSPQTEERQDGAEEAERPSQHPGGPFQGG